MRFAIRKIGAKRAAFKTQKGWLKNPKTLRAAKMAGMLCLTVALTMLVYYKEQAGDWFKASILEAPQPFNGTVPPIEKVPNWTTWKGDNKTTKFNEVPASDLIDLPPYDLAKMKFPSESLVWGNQDHDVIRNTKITYSVVYMGNYTLDHEENSGSHLGVDIRVPVGTPIHAIANGKVVKASTGSAGFGHHIVIKHINTPDATNPGRLTTLYSVYAHMDAVNVAEGQNVLKGELIGTSGQTGTATTPHLHFQIDRDSAPFHPYWPFTWADEQAAGLDFFGAINAGLGSANALANTINPIRFVTQYVGSYSVASESGSIPANPATIPETPTTVAVNTPPGNASGVDPSLFTFKISGQSASLVNNGVSLTVIDENNQVGTMGENDTLRAEVSGVGNLLKKEFRKSDFVNGVITLTVRSSEPGQSTITVGKSSFTANFITEVKQAIALKIESDGAFQKGVAETLKIMAVDSEGNPVPAISFSGVIQLTAKEGEAEFTPYTLAQNNFVAGVAQTKMTVRTSGGVIVRAQQGALVGESGTLRMEEDRAFTDITRTNAHYEAIKVLKDQGIIAGYSDGTFQPNKTVNRVEALKMLMLAFNVQAGTTGPLPFKDTDTGAWYAGTLNTAVAKAIVQGYSDGTFRPAQTVNKAEYLKILFKTAGVESAEAPAADPYSDVDRAAWFAPYAYLLNKKNLLDVPNNALNPAEGMTRAEVAETIYRLKMVQEKGLVTYSK